MTADGKRDGDTVRHLERRVSSEDLALIARAHRRLEHPSFAARLSGVVGAPLEIAFRLLPKDWYARLHGVAEQGIGHALDVALNTMRRGPQEPKQDRFHTVIGACSGAFGGFFGLAGLALELPVSTTIMMRAIADVARHEGEDLAEIDARMACVQVFALGGRTEQDDAAETGYYGVRLALALSTTRAVHLISRHGIQHDAAPAMARFVAAVAARFGVPLSQKAAVQLVPFVGAASGAAVNVIFLQHFVEMAHGHFSMRRLERKYGAQVVKAEYERITRAEARQG